MAPADPAVQAFTFGCGGETLVGLLHRAAAGHVGETAVLVVVGGPQYRAGSHRQFVQLARHLSGAGFPVMRFDVRGMGDSSGGLRGFEQIDDDIAAALDAMLQRQPQIKRVVLWGLCDGASAALLYLHGRDDARIQGLCLLNPWVRSEASLARTEIRHYYAQRLLQRAFWLKLLRGQVAGAALRGLWHSLRRSLQEPPPSAIAGTAARPYQERMAMAWHRGSRPVLLVLSGQDYTAREFEDSVARDPFWQGALERAGVQRLDVAAADHTFSTTAASETMEQATASWLTAVSPPANQAPTRPSDPGSCRPAKATVAS